MPAVMHPAECSARNSSVLPAAYKTHGNGAIPLVFDKVFQTLVRRRFLFDELVKRDFREKYKRTVLGMGWSILSPLLMLLVMRLVFTHFFGKTIPHYTTYIFCGNLVFTCFSEATKSGMNALMSNASIFTKVNVPKYLFLFSKNVSSLINFALTLVVFFVFVILDGVNLTPSFLALIYPIICMVVFNIGVGLILSAGFVFFRDIKYLYDVFLKLLLYLSAIFYSIDSFPMQVQRLFLLNPIYCYIKYFRIAVLDHSLPSLEYHLLCAGYALVAILIGGLIYKTKNKKFVYYV